MDRSQKTRPKSVQENAREYSKCLCPTNAEYAKKSDRTPLGDIQDSVNKKQYLSVEYGQQGRTGSRSTSLSLSNVYSPIKAESTRISHVPHIKPVLTKVPAAVTVRSTHKPLLQKPVRARSTSCRCSGTQNGDSSQTSKKDFGKTINKEDESDDVFIQPSLTKRRVDSKNSQVPAASNTPKIHLSSTQESLATENNKYFYEIQPLNQIRASSDSSNKVSTGLTSIHKARSAENINDGYNIKSTSSVSSTSSLGPGIKQRSQDSETFVAWITPKLLTSSQKTISSCTKSTAITEKRPQKSVLKSFPNSTPSQGTHVVVPKRSQNSTGPKESQGYCFTKSTTLSMQDPDKYTTLPSQNFVTLSQDTLSTTRNSENSEVEWMKSLPSKVTFVRDSSIVCEDEMTFVDGPNFFQGLEQGKSSPVKTVPVCSPLSNNDVPIRRRSSCSLSEIETGRRVKSNLRRSGSITKIILYPLLYSPEYLEDIISYSYRHINNLLLKAEWIETYMDRRYRTFIINWLHQVKELIVPQCDPVYYMAVRIFDFTVVRLRLRKSYYQLAAIVAFWLSLKFLDNSVLLKIPKMYALCNGKYSKGQILSMERSILKSTRFSLNMSDPLDFLHFYLKSSNLEKNELLTQGAKFVMECATLYDNFPSMEAPYVAASALYLANRILTNSKDVYVNFVWLERKKVQKNAENIFALNVKYAIMDKYEPLNKYLMPEKLRVAKEFFRVLI